MTYWVIKVFRQILNNHLYEYRTFKAFNFVFILLRNSLTIVNGLVRRALLRASAGLTFREESGARYFEEI